LSYAENWRFASNLFMKSMAAHPSAALQFPSAVDSRVGWRLPLKAKHLRDFAGSSQYFQWDWDARKTAGTFQLAHRKQRDSAAAGYKLLGASFAQHRRPRCAKTVASTPSLRFCVSASR
jgi:hypothetical protein